jgi:hypothetical protein
MIGASQDLLRTPENPHELRVQVLFTTLEETKAALRRAERLSAGLDAEIALILTPIVPFPLPLEQPPASLDFARDQIRVLADSVDREVVGYVYLCRDRMQMLESILRPCSLLVVGVSQQRLFGKTKRLVRALRRRGHDIITAPA